MKSLLFFTSVIVTNLLAHPVFGEEIPIQVKMNERGGGTITANCSHAGYQGPCVFDSGAVPMIPKNEITDRFPSMKSVTMEGVSDSSSTPCDLVPVDNWRAGSTAFQNRLALRCNQNYAPEIFTFMNFGDGLTVSLDFTKNVIDTKATFRAGSETHDLVNVGPTGAGFAASVGNSAFLAEFDTGAELTVVDPQLVAAEPAAFSYVSDIRLVTSVTASAPAKLYQLHALNVGQGTIQFGDTYVAAQDLSNLRTRYDSKIFMLFGMSHILSGDWTLDLKNGKWAVALHPNK